jgi:hypothetical protein
MGTLRKDVDITERVIVGRKCDVCGYEEISDRDAIKFDHGSDYRWVKVQLQLEDYTDPNDKRVYYACSAKCYVELVLKEKARNPSQSDCIGGVPLVYLRSLLTPRD